MSKLLKSFLFGLIAVALVTGPACRTRRTKPPQTQPPVVTDTAPNIPITTSTTATDAGTRVDQPDDFVRNDPTITEDVLPTDLEELNRVVHERGLIQDAFFGYDEAALSAQAQEALQNSANWLKRNPSYNLLIEGHCDERGTEQYNLALGDRRAHIVREYLETLGIDSARLRTVSYGEERPFDPGHDESSWAQNRRAHLVLVR